MASWMVRGLLLPLLAAAAGPLTGSAAAAETEDAQAYTVLQYEEADVTGDGRLDEIYGIGRSTGPGSIYYEDLNVLVRASGKSGYIKKQIGDKDSGYAGYNPWLRLADADGDGVQDVLASVESGENGARAYYNLLGFKKGSARNLVPVGRLNEPPSLIVRFIERFRAEIVDKARGIRTVLDLSAKKEAYIEQGVYDEDGTLLLEVEGRADPYSSLTPVEAEEAAADYTGERRNAPDAGLQPAVFEGEQSLSGLGRADTLGTAYSRWMLQDGKWTLGSLEIVGVDADRKR